MPDDVVITGLGVISPIGCDEQSFWDALYEGRSGAGPVDCLDTTELPRKIACQVKEPVDVVGWPISSEMGGNSESRTIPPRLKTWATLRQPMGRASQLAVAASRQAVASAGLDPSVGKNARLAVIVGTTMGETEFIEERLDAPEADWLSPDHMKRIAVGMPGSIAANVATDLQVEGQAVDVYGACAAGNLAITAARRRLLDGECDIALAGGADGFSRLAFIGFMRLRVMAAEVCRPFDEQRDGLLVGEGAVMFVLEKDSSAQARGAAIRARVAGAAITCEDYHPTRPHPDGEGLSRATKQALRDAGMKPSDIEYVCAHGTGTPQNDAIEARVMHKCFPDGVSFSSIKALTGHTMGAAAAMETACCVLSLQHQVLIPTWNLRNLLQPCSLDAIQGAPRPTRVRYVLNNSAGFGGYNSSVILAEA